MKNLYYKFRRIIGWLPVLWDDCYWDQSYLLRILEYKLREMAKFHRDHGHCMKSGRTAKQLFEASYLCKRMANEDYSSGPEWQPLISSNFDDFKFPDPMYLGRYHSDYLYQQDLDRLCLLFKKHLRTWWD